MKRIVTIAAALAVAAGPAAAGKHKGKAKAKAAAKTGSIAGVVTFKGVAPTPATGPSRAGDTYCATTSAQPRIVVHDGKLAGAYVRIKNGSFAGEGTPPAGPVVITQSKCEYTPRVVGLVAGQTLEVVNADPTFHNVRIVDVAGQLIVNKPQPKGAAPIDETLDAATGVAELHCDVHPWMQSWVVVSDHPHFAVTGDDGAFTLSGLAPGTYTVEAWHPDLGWQTSKVKVRKGKAAKAGFRFDLDDCGGC